MQWQMYDNWVCGNKCWMGTSAALPRNVRSWIGPRQRAAYVFKASHDTKCCRRALPHSLISHFSFLTRHSSAASRLNHSRPLNPARRKSRLHFLISRVLIPTLHKPPFLTLVIPHKVVCLHQRSCSLPKHLPSVHVDRRSGRHQQSPYYVSSTELPLFPSALTTTTVF